MTRQSASRRLGASAVLIALVALLAQVAARDASQASGLTVTADQLTIFVVGNPP
jgi:hypothetical protein